MSVLWTLPLEVQMYVLLPVAYLIGKKYRMRGVALVWLGAAVASYMPSHVTGRFMLAPYVPCFMAGVASYFIGFGSRRRRLPFVFWPLTIAAAAGIFFVLRSRAHFEGYWIMCAAIGLSAPLFAEMEFAPLRMASAWVARYSYGIYLTHMYALWTAFIVLKNQPVWIRCVVVVGLSVGLPVIFYKTIEAPMIGVGSRLANRLPRVTKARILPDAQFEAPDGSAADAAELADSPAESGSPEMES
jgi:peptidoglycan/LPS O-acetylase OafA/YrhL